jgi:hypothetical protein
MISGIMTALERVPGKVLAEAKEQERQEEFIASRVALGEPLDGLFPLSDARRPDYEAWLAQQPPPGAPRRPGTMEHRAGYDRLDGTSSRRASPRPWHS